MSWHTGSDHPTFRDTDAAQGLSLALVALFDGSAQLGGDGQVDGEPLIFDPAGLEVLLILV